MGGLSRDGGFSANPVKKNLFLTGSRGAGKTTILFRTLRELGVSIGGFVVKELYRHNAREELIMVDLSTGERGTMVRFIDGKPIPDCRVFDILGVHAIRLALDESRLVVLDELGRLELGASAFQQAVFDALSSSAPVVGVIKPESNPFLDAIRMRQDVEIIRVDTWNRDEAKRLLTQALVKLGLGASTGVFRNARTNLSQPPGRRQ